MRFGAGVDIILSIKLKFFNHVSISSIAPIAQCELPMVIAAPSQFGITAV